MTSAATLTPPSPPARAAEPAPPGSLRVTSHRPVLDGVRGAAILLVLAFHFLPTNLSPAPGSFLSEYAAFAGAGACGVDLFFVLSGFLITGICLDARDTPGYFRNFYARRFLRIFPLYYAVLFGCFVLLPRLHPFTPDEQLVAHRQGWLWTFTANVLAGRMPEWPFNGGRLSLDAFWSLCVEEHFYLFWPLAAYLLNRRALAWCCGLLILASPALRWLLYVRDDPNLAFYVWTPCRMDGLAMGALLAILARRPDHGALARRLAWPALIAAVTWIALTLHADARPDAGARALVYQTSQMTLLFAAGLVLAVTGGPRNPLALALTSPPFKFFGKYSYAIYVLHPLLLKNVVDRLVDHPRLHAHLAPTDARRTLATLALGLTFSALAGWLSWHAFEKHFLKLKRFFDYRRPASAHG